MRYLTFEINNSCNLRLLHRQCPGGHPERFKFGKKGKTLDDDTIVKFWSWVRNWKDFRGIILWNFCNEPTLAMDQINRVMFRIRQRDPGQPFLLMTNHKPGPETKIFDIVKFTDYTAGKQLDDRILSARGEGKPYSQMQPAGWCGRCFGWELIIDHFGNWCLCCNDWRCEESVGNIFTDDWDDLLQRFMVKSKALRWNDEASYNALPRMCRSCLEVNPSLHRTGNSY